MDYQLHNVGDQGLLIEFEPEISIGISQKVWALKYALEKQRLRGVRELVPAYRSLLIHYDMLTSDLDQILSAVDYCVRTLDLSQLPNATVTEIPVLYEGEYALDIEEIARMENKTVEEIIRIHSQSDYYIFMLCFSPGHPSTARFENPFSFKRRSSPRVRIAAGSIVVQLGLSDIIPFEQPCGWNIIGSTPISICDYRKSNPFLLQAGQWIRHVPVDKYEFLEIKRQVELGCYQCKTYERGK